MKKRNISGVYIYSMGCHQRSLDAQRISDYLKINGFKIVRRPRNADYILLITCAFKAAQEDFAIKKTEEFKKERGRLVVGGCLPKINKERLEAIFNGPTFAPMFMSKLDEIFEAKIKFESLPDSNQTFGLIPLDPVRAKDFLSPEAFKVMFHRFKDKIRGTFYVRISRGCLGRCSYCGIRNATGPLKSKPIKKCLSEFKKGVSLGYKNFALIADDLGAYGLDIGTTFPALLKEFLRIEENAKFYFFQQHPHWVIKYLNELIPIARAGRISEMTCSLQSGSNKILKLMNRFQGAEEIEDALNRLKEADPKLRILTHIIVGFPGETEEDFNETLRLLENINADHNSFFPYSEKPGLPAASLPEKVPLEIIKKRIKKAKRHGL